MAKPVQNICRMLIIFAFLFCSCDHKAQPQFSEEFVTTQLELYTLLSDKNLSPESKFSVINQISTNLLSLEKNSDLILFLTDYVKRNPEDKFNAYWLLMTAYAYQQSGADPIAELYFERIIRNYDDLIVQDKSIHKICLQNLVQISTSAENRVDYFNRLINGFSNEVNKTELYFRLAQEYETLGNWNQVLTAYSLFLSQPDAATSQIAGIPDAYNQARKLIDFNNSPKDWTFESLEALETAIKSAISRYNYTALDRYKSKVNFFAMSWKQEDTDANSQQSFSMRDYGTGNRIRFNTQLDESSNPNEAYLRTWGWSQYVNVWYLYFRKVNFPVDPEIHGRWEWAGIYFGEKL